MPTTYTYTRNSDIPSFFWLFVLVTAYSRCMSHASVRNSLIFQEKYQKVRGSYSELRDRLKQCFKTFGVSKFVYDGILPDPGDDKAGNLDDCRMLASMIAKAAATAAVTSRVTLNHHPPYSSDEEDDWDMETEDAPLLQHTNRYSMIVAYHRSPITFRCLVMPLQCLLPRLLLLFLPLLRH